MARLTELASLFVSRSKRLKARADHAKHPLQKHFLLCASLEQNEIAAGLLSYYNWLKRAKKHKGPKGPVEEKG